MRRLAVLVAIGVTGVVLLQGAAQGAFESAVAKKTATIPIPSDGNAAVAHLVLKATPKKGKKPKKPSKRPKLKVSKAPAGVAIVAASYKRDAKNKNVWHATVALTNPYTKQALRTTSSVSDEPGDEGDIVILVIDGDDAYVVTITVVQIEENVTFEEMPVPPWMATNCDPPGSAGDLYLFGPGPAGVSPSEFLDYGCELGADGANDFDAYDELGLVGIAFDLDPFPGNPNEFYVNFEIFNRVGVNGVAFGFPDRTVTAQLPPTGFAGVISPGTVTFGNKNQPFAEGQMYRGNVRLNTPVTTGDILNARFTTTGGPPYSTRSPAASPPSAAARLRLASPETALEGELMSESARKYAAELFGTFTLVFVGSVAILATKTGPGNAYIQIGFGFGLALLAGLYAFGEISGGHFNPIVSLAMVLDGRLGRGHLIPYWIAQLAGAVLASVCVWIAFDRSSVKLTGTYPGPSGAGTAFFLEVLASAIFVLVILKVTQSGTFGGTALIAIPLTLAAAHFALIPFSGSSLNTARTFGPDVIGGKWTDFWVYLLAPPLGAVVGWAIYRTVAHEEPAKAAAS